MLQILELNLAEDAEWINVFIYSNWQYVFTVYSVLFLNYSLLVLFVYCEISLQSCKESKLS